MSDKTTLLRPDTTLGGPLALYGVELGAGAMVGAYVIEETRSRGGSGVVYRATGPSGEAAAVKVLHAQLTESPSALARFQQEVRVIQQIGSPGVVAIHACGDLTDGRPYLVMEWLPGRTLDEELRARGPFDVAPALAVMEELCDALASAHAAGVVHRDIKGSNVMLVPAALAAEGRRVKLLDFGIAKRLDADARLTGTGVRVGTPNHMAPEQILGQRITPATDVYALGILLFQMLTGRFPFVAESTMELEIMHLDATPPFASDLAKIPDAVSDVIQRCLAKRPAHRYASVDELIEDLRAAAADAERPRAAFRVQATRAAGFSVAWAGDPEMEAKDEATSALAAARRECEAEGWMTTWAGERAFLAAVILPSREQGARALTARAIRMAESLSKTADGGTRPLSLSVSVRVHTAPVIVLFVQGMPQIVGGAFCEGLEGAFTESPLTGWACHRP